MADWETARRGGYGAYAHRCGRLLFSRPLSPRPCKAAALKGPTFCFLNYARYIGLFCLFFAHNAREIFFWEPTSACADAPSACGYSTPGVIFGGVGPTALSRNNMNKLLSVLFTRHILILSCKRPKCAYLTRQTALVYKANPAFFVLSC